LNGSAAAQKIPPPASNVHIIIEIHLNVLISGLSKLPSLIFPNLEKPIKRAIKNVPSNTNWYKTPKYVADRPNKKSTALVTNSALISEIITNNKRILPLIINDGRSNDAFFRFVLFI